MGNMSSNGIGRRACVTVAVLKWVQAEAAQPAGAGGGILRDHYGGGRDVALSQKSLPSQWSGGPVTWISGAPWPGFRVPGGRDDETCRRLINTVGLAGKLFVTDDWKGYHRVIPESSVVHRQGPDLPDGAGQQQHPPLPGAVPMPHQVVSKCRTMVDLSPCLLHHLTPAAPPARPPNPRRPGQKVRSILGQNPRRLVDQPTSVGRHNLTLSLLLTCCFHSFQLPV